MKKLIYLIVVIAVLGLIVTGCIPVVPPSEQSELSILTRGIDIYVATTGSDTSGTTGTFGDPYLTISYAISQASPGDTINVAAGIYTEQLLITKSLTIIGAGGATIIKAPAARAGAVTQGSSWDYIVAAYPTTGTINVRIEGFTIDADSQPKKDGTAGLIGVFFRDVSGTNAGLYSCTIQDFGTTEYESWSVRVYGDSDLTIDGNTLTGYTRDGIAVNGDNGVGADPDVVISNNDLTGSSIPLNGIQIAFGATGTIIGNTVRDHTRSTPWAAVGIFAFKSNGIIISSNTVQNSNDGILLKYSSNCEVLENEVSDSGWGIVLNNADDNKVLENEISDSKTGISDSKTGISLSDSHDNEVLRNEIEDLTHEGILLLAGSSRNKVEKNEVSDSGWGIVLNGALSNEVLQNEVADSVVAGISAWWSSGNLIKKNEVSGSGGLGDLYDSSAPAAPPLDNDWEDNEYDTKNW